MVLFPLHFSQIRAMGEEWGDLLPGPVGEAGFGRRPVRFGGPIRTVVASEAEDVLKEQTGYRPDIDGLRAVAVLAVVVYHAFPRMMPGGYLGVDAFFVVSGYLITGILSKEAAQGRIHLGDFYARRIRRILPALVLVLAASAIWGWFRLLADEHASLGKHLAASATFCSNLLLRSESGYFDAAAQTKPLLHLWSLAVEEQFYLVWPWILAVAWKVRRPLLVVTLVAVASLGGQILQAGSDPAGAFYLPHLRFWELALGGWLSLHGFRGSAPAHSRGRSIGGLLGMALLATSLVFCDPSRVPGPLASLWAVTGTVLVVASGAGGWISRWILSRRLLVGIGLVSYPLYLWHWPLLSFAAIEQGLPAKGVRIALVLASGGLAWLTWWGLERRIRHAPGWRVVAGLLAALAAMGLWGGACVVSDGFEGTAIRIGEKTDFARALDNTPPRWGYFERTDMPRRYRRDCDFYDMEAYRAGHAHSRPMDTLATSCTERDPRIPKAVLLWGDSHAAMLRPGLDAALSEDWQILQVATSGCDPSLELDRGEPFCRTSNREALELVERSRPEVVVLSQFKDHDPDVLQVIGDRLETLGVRRVVFVGPSPHWEPELPRQILRHRWTDTSSRSREGLDPSRWVLDSLLRHRLAREGRVYVSLLDALCDRDGCLMRIGPDRVEGITSWDQSHLTPVASEQVARAGLVRAIAGP